MKAYWCNLCSFMFPTKEYADEKTAHNSKGLVLSSGLCLHIVLSSPCLNALGMQN